MLPVLFATKNKEKNTMDEWEFIFDFRVREVIKDHLTFTDMGLLFFLAKNITDKEFMENTQPELFKNFKFKDILKLKTFYMKPKQLGRLIDKLVNADYIKTQKLFGGVSVALTFKYFNSISPKQFNAPDNQKYFFLLKWSKMSELAFEIGRKCPSFYSYYKSNIKNNNNININNNLDTKKVNSISSNKGSGRKGETFFEKLKPFFEKYPRFKVDRATLLPSGFDCQRLMQVMERSKFLQNNERIDFEWLMSHYAKVTTKLESGKFTYDDYYQSTDKKAFCTRNYAPDDPVFKFSNLDDIVI